jgi:predicted small lipoprotein YifL
MLRRLSLLAVLLLAACGQAGGLYLPDQAPKKQNPLKKVSPPPAGAPVVTPNQAPAPAPTPTQPPAQQASPPASPN